MTTSKQKKVKSEEVCDPLLDRIITDEHLGGCLLKENCQGEMDLDEDTIFMRMALQEARAAGAEGEVPIGAVIVHAGAVVGKAHNQVEQLKDPTAHAEILAITQAASALGDWRLLDTRLYVTKEPCPMCAGAIVSARIPHVLWGTDDPSRGGATIFKILDHPNLNHRPLITTGVLADESLLILQNFFGQRRNSQR